MLEPTGKQGSYTYDPSVPAPHLLRDQQEVMGRYLHILEIRAELEGLDLGKESFCHKACCACEEKIIRPVASL